MNKFGTGPLSAPSNAATPVGLPTAPNGLVATRGDGFVDLSWSAPTSDGGSAITGYSVEVRSGTTSVSTTPVTGTTTRITGLTPGTGYTFRVSAVNSIGTGPSAATGTVVFAVAPTAPVTVTAASGAAGGALTAIASWTTPPSTGGSAITGFRVRAVRILADGTEETRALQRVNNGNARSLQLTLIAGNYEFEVEAINAVGFSAPSTRSNRVAAR